MHDVAVIGGGPAGASAARLLALWGHDVALVSRPSPPAGWLAESIPASARKLFEAVGLLDALDAADFFPNRGNTVWWAGAEKRREPFPDRTSGVHAERVALERILLAAARGAGVRLELDAPVRAVAREGPGWRVEWGEARLEARWLLDASGRAGALARRERQNDPVATLALVGRVRRRRAPPENPEGDATHTLIESYRDGWAWSVPLAGDVRCVTAMVDPRRTDLRRDGDIDAMFAAELAKTTDLRRAIAGLEPAGPVRACPASLYGSRRYALDGAFFIGDAGSFIDPLSSYGVKKALASAWLAAIACHTALEDESAAPMAREYFDAREREVYRRYRALSIPFFDGAARAHEHAFWVARLEAAAEASAGVEAPGAGPAGGDPADRFDPASDADAFVGRREVREAYEEIRRRDTVDLRRSPDSRTVRAPLVRGRRIESAPHLASDSAPRPLRYVRNVDMCRLVAEAPRHPRVPEMYESYNRSGPPAELPDFLAALATAVGLGFLTLPDWRPRSG